MAVAVTSRAWREAQPERVDDELTALWRDLGRAQPVQRAVLANLVVFCDRTGKETVDLTAPLEPPLEEVARLHPSRMVIFQHDPSCSPGRPLAVVVSVLTFGSGDARYGVEQIAIRAACGEASLPSIVHRVTLGGLPTTVWWSGDLSDNPEPSGPLSGLGRQFLFDSRLWSDVDRGVDAVRALVRGNRPPALADLNWRRLSPLRRALLHGVTSTPRSRGEALRIRIRHRRGEAALAWLLAAWFETPAWSRETQTTVGSGAVTSAEDSALAELLSVSIAISEPKLFVVMSEESVTVTWAAGAKPPLIGALPRESLAESVASELRSMSRNLELRDAVLTRTGS
jgi:glucose-6-phosphate dehydrogenase assembly protein OpcA